jgi:hypothetical protein
MRRTNRMVLGLVAVFVLGSSLALLGCGSDDDEANITNVSDQATAASLLGGQVVTFADGTVFGVTPAGTPTTLAFNATATRFNLSAPGLGRSATGTVTYGSCILTTGPGTGANGPNATGGGSNFPANTGPQANSVTTLNPCQFNSDTGTITVTTGQGTATSDSRRPTGTGGFGG